MWSSFLNETRNIPAGVRKPLRPWLIGTGPAMTLPPRSSQAWFVESRTQARAVGAQGTLAAAADGAAAVAGAAVAAVAVPNRVPTRVIASTSARRIVTTIWSPHFPVQYSHQPCSPPHHAVAIATMSITLS